ncbi:hypothetical protein AB4851_08260 [Burkholderia sp. 22PA0099]|uniref:hypothetical protein n=1 Tax=Burkholderia sp. 22PA0099 TaxID=3237372 RepID=UPI0039C3D54F
MSTQIIPTEVSDEAPVQIRAYYAAPGENPALANAPKFANPKQAAMAMEWLPDLGPGNDISADDRILLPTSSHTRLVLAVARAVRASAQERNLADSAFQAKIIQAHRFVNHRRDARNHPTSRTAATLSNVAAKVHFAVVPDGAGQHALVHALDRVFNAGHGIYEVPLQGRQQGMRFARMDTIVAQFPPNGRPVTFARALVKQINPIFETRIGRLSFSDDEVTTTVQSLLLSLNVGLLIIGPVSGRISAPEKAGEMWSMLAQVAASTGIPIVIVGAPGAAVNMVTHGDGVAALTSRGSYIIQPVAPGSRESINASTLIWLKYFRRAGTEAPEWFHPALTSLTQGNIEYAVALGAYVASVWEAGGEVRLSPKILEAHAARALVLHKSTLDSNQAAKAGKSFTLYRLKQLADGLPLEIAIEARSKLEDEDDYTQKREIKPAPAIIEGNFEVPATEAASKYDTNTGAPK